MSILHAEAEEYLALRRALGFKLRREGYYLPQFATWMRERGAVTVTTALAIEWAGLPAGVHPVTWSHRLSAVRQFTRWLAVTDPETEVPPDRVFPGQGSRPDPYIYSDEEVAAILSAARVLRPAFWAATFQTLVGVLAVTGIRIGEALALASDDIDLDAGTLTVREGKSRSPRMLPLHPETTAALAEYAAARDALYRGADTFFTTARGRPLNDGTVREAFHRMARAAGIQHDGKDPRVHDLRHTFAVRQMLEWYRAGRDAGDLTLLSGYLGHANPADTYWYVSAVPELMQLAAGRLARNGAQP
ncbi:MAG TPA: tyrosine-type recombinase/integrase [Trebonia sp.]